MVAVRPGKTGSHLCLWPGASVGVVRMAKAWLVQGLACVNEALGDVGKSKLEKHFFLVFSGLQGFGPADGGCCRSQKLMPHIRNIGVGLSIQWCSLQKSVKKAEEESWVPSQGRHLVCKVVGRRRRNSPLGGKNKAKKVCKVKRALNESLCDWELWFSQADCLLASEEEFSVPKSGMIWKYSLLKAKHKI